MTLSRSAPKHPQRFHRRRAQRVLRDFVNPETEKIIIDSRENFQKLETFAAEYTPAVSTPPLQVVEPAADESQ